MKSRRSASAGSTRRRGGGRGRHDDAGDETDDGAGLFDNPFEIRSDSAAEPDSAPELASPPPASPITEADRRDALDLITVTPHTAPPPAARDAAAPSGSASSEGSEPPESAIGHSAPAASTTVPAVEAAAEPAVAPGAGAVEGGAVAPSTSSPAQPAPGFLSPAPPRLRFESALVRLIATAGVVGIGTAVGAILVANDVAGWITGLSVSLVSVILAAVLWRSRRL